MADSKYHLKIVGVPSEAEYNRLPFGRQIDYRHKIQEFKDSARHTHFSVKGKSVAKGFAEFKKLYQPTQWFFVDRNGPMWHDDSIEVWYKTRVPMGKL